MATEAMNYITKIAAIKSFPLEHRLSFLLERLESFQSVFCWDYLQENYHKTILLANVTHLSIASLLDPHSCSNVSL